MISSVCSWTEQSTKRRKVSLFQAEAELENVAADRAPRKSLEELQARRQVWMRQHNQLRRDYENASNPHQRKPWLRTYRVPPAVFDDVLDVVHAVREEVAARARDGKSLPQHAGLAQWAKSTTVPTIILVAAVLRWMGGVPYHALWGDAREILSTSTFYRYLHSIARVVVQQLGHHISFPFNPDDAEAHARAFVMGGEEAQNSSTYIYNTIGAVDGYHIPVKALPRCRRGNVEDDDAGDAGAGDHHDGAGGGADHDRRLDDPGYISPAALIGRDGKASVNCQVVASKRAKVLFASCICGGATPDSAAFERTILYQSMLRYDVDAAVETATESVRGWRERQRSVQDDRRQSAEGSTIAQELGRRLNEISSELRVAETSLRSVLAEKARIDAEDRSAAALAAANGRAPPSIPKWPPGMHLVLDNGYTQRVACVSPFPQLVAAAYNKRHTEFPKAVLRVNYNVSRQRQVSERVFALLERKFPRFRWGFEIDLNHVPTHFLMVCILHNTSIVALDAEQQERFWATEDQYTLREVMKQVQKETKRQRKIEARRKLADILHTGAEGFAAHGREERNVIHRARQQREGGDGDDDAEDAPRTIVEAPGGPLKRGEAYRELIQKRLMDLQNGPSGVNWAETLPQHRGQSTEEAAHARFCADLLMEADAEGASS